MTAVEDSEEAMREDTGKYGSSKVSDFEGGATRNGKFRNTQNVEGNANQLLPGIVDDIVLDHIVPKLPWRAFHVLSSVSPSWRHAIHSRQIYNARVRSKSLETLVAFDHYQPGNSGIHAMSVFSVRDDSWRQLPKFPFYEKGLPETCSCVSLDGKFYVFPHCTAGYGVEDTASSDDGEDSASRNCSGNPDGVPLVPNTGREVFVLDLVGQRGWKRCADMPEARCFFACCVLHEKVYVLGGKRTGSILLGDNLDNGFGSISPTRECLMYDPEEDCWSSIAPMNTNRFRHEVMVLGDQLWVDGGSNEREPFLDPEVYHPVENKWRHILPARCDTEECLFAAKGKVFMMSLEPHAEVLCEGHSIQEEPLTDEYPQWKHEHTLKIHANLVEFLSEWGTIPVLGAQAVDDELFVLIEISDGDGFGHEPCRCETALFRNRTFGRDLQNRECLALDVEPTTFSQHGRWARFMCPIEL